MDKESLMVAGIYVEDALRRFMGNENLLKRMLSKFINDTTINDLRKGIEANDHELMFRSAHTLKGIAGNLSLSKLYQVTSSQTELFRAGKDEEGILMMSQVEEAYKSAVDAINSI